MQNELSVQFDDLFKKAWEEDVAEFEKDGMSSLHVDIFLRGSTVCEIFIYKLSKLCLDTIADENDDQPVICVYW